MENQETYATLGILEQSEDKKKQQKNPPQDR
jgi:hypothetical protein